MALPEASSKAPYYPLTTRLRSYRGFTEHGVELALEAADEIEKLQEGNAQLRQRVRQHDSFLETLKDAILLAQGIERGSPLGRNDAKHPEPDPA